MYRLDSTGPLSTLTPIKQIASRTGLPLAATRERSDRGRDLRWVNRRSRSRRDDSVMTDLFLPDIAPRDRLPSPALLARLDRPGPRYTSYPTADRFDVGLDRRDASRAWQANRDTATPLALYVHLPFCESVCYYCACNKIATRHHEHADSYLAALIREADLALRETGPRPASALHLGGGTPTFFTDEQLEALVRELAARWPFTKAFDCSIEVDPRTVDVPRLARLREIGFSRISFGVQDFDPTVQVAVHRIQSFDDVRTLMNAARAERFESINVDLIYGLPRQTPSSFTRTIAMTASLRPDRIALYGYAHLPARFKPQRRISEADLPDASGRVFMLDRALNGFVDAGYEYIGMDHFALPTDVLAIAKRERRLQRDFQGYGVQSGDLLGLGVSAISRVGAVYTQNARGLDAYFGAVAAGRVPIERGLVLSADDELRRVLIMQLMCDGRIDFPMLETRFAVDARRYFAREITALEPFVADGLVSFASDGVRVTRSGWFLVRSIAMVFDRHLQEGGAEGRFSRVV